MKAINLPEWGRRSPGCHRDWKSVADGSRRMSTWWAQPSSPRCWRESRVRSHPRSGSSPERNVRGDIIFWCHCTKYQLTFSSPDARCGQRSWQQGSTRSDLHWCWVARGAAGSDVGEVATVGGSSRYLEMEEVCQNHKNAMQLVNSHVLILK